VFARDGLSKRSSTAYRSSSFRRIGGERCGFRRRALVSGNLLIHPAVSAFPDRGVRAGLRIDLFEACSAFTHAIACTLALSPIVTRIFIQSFMISISHGAVLGMLRPFSEVPILRRNQLCVIEFGSSMQRVVITC